MHRPRAPCARRPHLRDTDRARTGHWRGPCLAEDVILRPCLAAPLIVAALCLARTAGAQEKDADLERARALFDRAGELERQGQWPAAQENLRTALRIRETPNLRYALGWALENDDQLLEARTEYELALRLSQRAGNEEVANLASQRIAEVDRKTPLVQVRIRGTLGRGTRVLVDGREVVIRGDAGTVPVDPGTRLVRVERDGRPPSEQSVSVTRGVLRVVELKGDDSISVHDENGVTTERSVLPWALVGSGGALLVTGAILFASSAGDASTRDEKTAQWCDAVACSNGMASRTETPEAAALRRDAYDAASRGNTKQVIGGIVGAVGAVGAVVGVVMLVQRSRGPETTKKASRLAIDAAPLTGGGFANASLTF